MLYLKLIVIALVLFIALDSIWFMFVMGGAYREALGDTMRQDFGILSALLVYILLAVGSAIFVLQPSAGRYDATAALWKGALFGLVVYGVYDLTNHAILNRWPMKIVIIDILWGCFACAVTNTVTTFIAKKFF